MDTIPGPHATRLTRSLLDLSSPKRGSTLDTRPSSAAAARSTKTDTFLRVHTMIHDKPHNESKCGHGWCGRTRFPLKPENQGRHELHRNSTTATNKHELGPWPVISGVYVTQLRPMYLIREWDAVRVLLRPRRTAIWPSVMYSYSESMSCQRIY